GVDTVDQLAPGSTVTIGGGTLYSNLSLEAFGSGLRVKTSSNNYVYLSDWYSTTAGAGGKAVSTLQIVIEGTKDYKPTSSNPMNNAKIVAFDFLGLVAAFDAARAAGQTFNLANSLPSYRLWSSDTDAIGGAIAYEYAKSGSLGTLTHDQMRTAINAPGFAGAPQSIASAASLMPLAGETAAGESASVGEPPATADADGGTPAKLQAPEITGPISRTVDSGASGFDGQASPELDPRPSAALQVDRAVFSRLADIGTRPAARASAASGADAAVNAAAWHRIARDLPIHLDGYIESGMNVSIAFRNPNVGPMDTSLPVVAAVGVTDTGGHRLRQFEGLKEGIASIA
ncbi:MAG: hypothetical protein ACREVG_11080, partial [Burkholderiales bacterium]